MVQLTRKPQHRPVKSRSAVVAGKARVEGAGGINSPVGYDDSVEVVSRTRNHPKLPSFHNLAPPFLLLLTIMLLENHICFCSVSPKSHCYLSSQTLTVDQSSDNNDFCSACGGTGYLLCCDGCNSSFHFTCCDPPLAPNASELDEPWFCSVCEARRSPPSKQPRGLFSMPLNAIARQNTTAFEVPEAIRDYFEGVKTGPEGEYDEDLIMIKQG